MPPIVSIVGKAKSVKTTFLEKLVRELRLRGYHVATIKHTDQDITFDRPGKDSYRHIQAGSEATAISANNNFVLIIPEAKDLTLDEMARIIGDDYDILLTEGFKQTKIPKIEIHRREVGSSLNQSLNGLIAIVTNEPLDTGIRQFSLEDIKGVAELVETDFIKPNRQRISLYINHKKVPLSSFPHEIIGNILFGIASSLKGVKTVRGMDISLRR